MRRDLVEKARGGDRDAFATLAAESIGHLFNVAQLMLEIYGPGTGTFTQTGPMAERRTGQAAALLADGRVLVAGGVAASTDPSPLASAELYNPGTGTFSPAGSGS